MERKKMKEMRGCGPLSPLEMTGGEKETLGHLRSVPGRASFMYVSTAVFD